MRLDTKLEAEGAVFLVLGRLLVEKIATFKAYENYANYDLISANADMNTAASIMVKSCYRTDWDGFIINNYDCDFVVLALLNRGFNKQKKNGDTGLKEPEFYVLPISYVLEVREQKHTRGKISRNRLKDIEQYKNRWDLVSTFLSQKQ